MIPLPVPTSQESGADYLRRLVAVLEADRRRRSAASAAENPTSPEPSGVEISFETVAKNLSAVSAALVYDAQGRLESIVYASGVVKTLHYSGDRLTSVVLSGATPAGVALTKTLLYTGNDLTGVAYS